MYYATHNIYANLVNGNRGFANSWEVSRFKTRAEREAFIEKYENKAARAVSRDEASKIFRDTYLCVGKEPPTGGLFGGDKYAQIGHFWNEANDI